MSTDVIADMLSSIKNASMVGKEFVELPHSKMREAIAKVLADNGFVKEVKVFKESGLPYKSLHIDLAYFEDGKPRIFSAKRVSKPGRRLYWQNKEIKKMNPKFGLIVMSTPKGVMSGEDARSKNLGGEIICELK